MADKLIETIARWLCEERDPGIMLTDPGYWTRYKPEAMELISALDKAGMVVVPKEPTPKMIAEAERAKADAWDKGYWAGHSDGASNRIAPDNPYRSKTDD